MDSTLTQHVPELSTSNKWSKLGQRWLCGLWKEMDDKGYQNGTCYSEDDHRLAEVKELGERRRTQEQNHKGGLKVAAFVQVFSLCELRCHRKRSKASCFEPEQSQNRQRDAVRAGQIGGELQDRHDGEEKRTEDPPEYDVRLVSIAEDRVRVQYQTEYHGESPWPFNDRLQRLRLGFILLSQVNKKHRQKCRVVDGCAKACGDGVDCRPQYDLPRRITGASPLRSRPNSA